MLTNLFGHRWLMASMMRSGKGAKDRITRLPKSLKVPLQMLFKTVKEITRATWPTVGATSSCQTPSALNTSTRRGNGAGNGSLGRKKPKTCEEGHHRVHESLIQKAIIGAVKMADLAKRVTCHTLRSSFATQLIESGDGSRTVQELLGHKDVKTAMMHTPMS
ncbi:tyrosine-type recombinase/integrase [Desulfosoma caldarium]|uniref:tyrosine-type recombinase/integrase n=1 Tax=Desulfosoma caldarium TaxID=610254 RepID=UPI0014761D3E|nr:tyrosine-type recombinase/integrase [Desulfosoma caldarium]